MNENIKITNIEFEKSDGEKIVLSLNEAKELYQQLHELFEKQTVVYPYPYPYNPCEPSITYEY